VMVARTIKLFAILNTHHHAPTVGRSLIEKPTLEQIRQFDPKTERIVRRAAMFLSESFRSDQEFGLTGTKVSESKMAAAIRSMVETDAETALVTDWKSDIHGDGNVTIQVSVDNVTIQAGRDINIRDTFNNIYSSHETEDILDALKDSTARLQKLKAEYVAAVKSDGGIEGDVSGKRRLIFYGILRTIETMDTLMDELKRRGAVYEIDINYREHPNSAFERLTALRKAVPSEAVFWCVVIALILIFWWILIST
jgi:hypothetical protein